jgi:radical SAM superfamily enzyme YgiQ (UPF0313 family)
MKHFVYYFIQTSLSKMDIPFWMRFAPPVLKPGVQLQDMPFNAARALYYRFYDSCVNNMEWTCTCIDTLIYSSYRTLRATGSWKSTTDKRIMRPVFTSSRTALWTTLITVGTAFTYDAIKEANTNTRITWMGCCLGLRPKVKTLVFNFIFYIF